MMMSTMSPRAATGQLTREAELHTTLVTPVRPCRTIQPPGVVTPSCSVDASPAVLVVRRRREQRERVVGVEGVVVQRLREAAAAWVRVEAAALAAAVDEAAVVQGHGADVAGAAVAGGGVAPVVGERERAA